MNEFSRTELLIGKFAADKLKDSRIIVFGVGGVGSFVCEALARSGIGEIAVVDNDTVSETNINRQLIALHSTVGMPKVDVMAERIHDISPSCSVTAYDKFYMQPGDIDISRYDFIVDAIDTVSAKLNLIEDAQRHSVPIISCMGTGNKLDPTMFEITDIYKTSVCPLARVMRRELKARGIKHLRVLYSKEEPIKPGFSDEKVSKRQVPGSMPFVPPVAGMIIAGEVVKTLIGQ